MKGRNLPRGNEKGTELGKQSQLIRINQPRHNERQNLLWATLKPQKKKQQQLKLKSRPEWKEKVGAKDAIWNIDFCWPFLRTPATNPPPVVGIDDGLYTTYAEWRWKNAKICNLGGCPYPFAATLNTITIIFPSNWFLLRCSRRCCSIYLFLSPPRRRLFIAGEEGIQQALLRWD